jgi:hypothetical protein
MEEEPEVNLDWWKEAKAMSLERKAASKQSATGVDPGDTFLIVTEGTVTEPTYFVLLRDELQLPTVTIRILPGDASDPRHVILTAEKIAREQREKAAKRRIGFDEPEWFDHVWAVVDTDVASRLGFWNEVVQLANSRGVSLAHSTPCFEYWLLLHLEYTTRSDLHNGAAAKSAVKEALQRDYSTSAATALEALKEIVPLWPRAVAHAVRVRAYHFEARTRDPANPSTQVDLLVGELRDSVPRHRQPL